MIWIEETRKNLNVRTDDSKMNKIWPLLLKSSWSMPKSKNIRQKENNVINEKCCVYLCMRERKDIVINKAVWGKQIYISKNNYAERKCSRSGSVTTSVPGMGISVPSRTFEEENEINTTSGKAKSLLCLTHMASLGTSVDQRALHHVVPGGSSPNWLL